MALEVQEPGTPIGLSRGSELVFVPVAGRLDMAEGCLAGLLETVDRDVPILVIEDGGEGDRLREFLSERAGGHTVYYRRNSERMGFVATANQALRDSGEADVVIVNSDCLVAGDWLRRMVDAAASDSRVATVSTLTNHGTILSVPVRNDPRPNLPPGWDVKSAAAAVEAASPRSRPEIPVAVGHCVLITRRALDLVGLFDESFSPGYGEEVDFSQRCVRQGLAHIVADDVFVEHRGGASFGDNDSARLKMQHKAVIDDRYPHHEPVVEEIRSADEGPLARSLLAARIALNGLSVTVDGRCLGGAAVTGTVVHALGVIEAIAGREGVTVRVLVPDDLGPAARERLSELPNLELITVAQAWEGAERTAIVHRPFQVMSEYDLELLPLLGERIVVTQQDMIAWANPFYFESAEDWLAYRRLTRHVLSLADLTLFFSEHSAKEAIEAEVVDPDRSAVVPIGTDHLVDLAIGNRPGELPDDRRPFILCLGTDFHHKNRSFAIRLAVELARQHGWEGRLAFAGPAVKTGSSRDVESAVVTQETGVSDEGDLILDLGEVSEEEKAWLLTNAEAVLYPTTYEGFGLLPFEAARAGTPCLFAAQTSLAEYLPTGLATIEPWDIERSAASAASLLANPQRCEAQVGAILGVGERLTWQRTGAELVAAYLRATKLPVRRERDLAREASDLTVQVEILEKQKAEQGQLIDELNAILDNEARALVGPDAVLPGEMKRPLIGISRRPALRALFFAPIMAAHRVVSRFKGG